MNDEKTYCCPACGHVDPRLQDTCGDCGKVFYIWETTIGGMCQECIDAQGMT